MARGDQNCVSPVYFISGLLLKSICDGDEIEDIDCSIAVDIWCLLTEGVCNSDEIQDIDGAVTIDIGW